MSNISCRKARKLLQSSLAGELASGRQRILSHHLRDCPDCHREAELQRSLDAALCVHLQADPPADLWNSVQNRVAKGAPARTGFRRLLPQVFPGVLRDPLWNAAMALSAVGAAVLLALAAPLPTASTDGRSFELAAAPAPYGSSYLAGHELLSTGQAFPGGEAAGLIIGALSVRETMEHTR